METYDRIREITDANVIYCLPPLILSLMVIELLFRNRFKTKKVLNVVRWLIISYTAAATIFYFAGMTVSPQKYAFANRATGPYWFAYWLMLFSATLLPFSLLIKRLATRFLYVLLIAFGMKIGFYFERFVIITTSLHRGDYFPYGEETSFWSGFLTVIGIFFLQGLLLALLLLGLLELSGRIKSSQRTASKHPS